MKFQGITISKKCPKRFTWRGQQYELAKLDQKKAEKLMNDPDFPFITAAKSGKTEKKQITNSADQEES